MKTAKDYINLSPEEKEKLVRKAIEGANEDQASLIKLYAKSQNRTD